MLSARIAPPMVKYAQLRYASSYKPILMQSVTTMQFLTSSTGKETRLPTTSVDYAASTRSSNICAYRSFASDQPSVPSKDKFEKIFFKITVILWDILWNVSTYSWDIIKQYIIFNPTVQSYWKIFVRKLNEARKQ